MIDIVNNDIILNDIDSLLEPNPINTIFFSLKKIWDLNKNNIPENYRIGEKLSHKFELLIYDLYSEIYDILIHQIKANEKINTVLQKEEYCLVIMDGMSLREIPSVLNELSHYNIEYNYAYSNVPSTTEHFTKKYFDSRAPSTIKSCEKYTYYYLNREDKINEIPKDEDKLVIWSTQPDKHFSNFTSSFELYDLEELGIITSRIIKRITEHLEKFNEIIITSDHGYFVDLYSWEGINDFPSSDRYANYIPKFLKQYCKYVDDFYVLYGRFNTIKRGKYFHIRHGGLSFLETIVPFIRIKRGD